MIVLRNVYQDGADFYSENYGHVWTAPFKVLDFDMEGAQRARNEFINWAADMGYIVEFEEYGQ